MHVAATKLNSDVIAYLVSGGCNVSLPDSFGDTALDVAIRTLHCTNWKSRLSSQELLSMVLALIADPEQLWTSPTRPRSITLITPEASRITSLLKLGVPVLAESLVNMVLPSFNRPLHHLEIKSSVLFAVRKGHVEIFTRLANFFLMDLTFEYEENLRSPADQSFLELCLTLACVNGNTDILSVFTDRFLRPSEKPSTDPLQGLSQPTVAYLSIAVVRGVVNTVAMVARHLPWSPYKTACEGGTKRTISSQIWSPLSSVDISRTQDLFNVFSPFAVACLLTNAKILRLLITTAEESTLPLRLHWASVGGLNPLVCCALSGDVGCLTLLKDAVSSDTWQDWQWHNNVVDVDPVTVLLTSLKLCMEQNKFVADEHIIIKLLDLYSPSSLLNAEQTSASAPGRQRQLLTRTIANRTSLLESFMNIASESSGDEYNPEDLMNDLRADIFR